MLCLLSSQKVENELITVNWHMNDESFDFAQTAELHAQCVMKCRLLTHYFTVEVDWLRLLKKERARKCWKVSITVVSSRCSSFKLSSCKVCSHLFMVKLYMFTNRAWNGKWAVPLYILRSSFWGEWLLMLQPYKQYNKFQGTAALGWTYGCDMQSCCHKTNFGLMSRLLCHQAAIFVLLCPFVKNWYYTFCFSLRFVWNFSLCVVKVEG